MDSLEIGDISGLQDNPQSQSVVDWLLVHDHQPTDFPEEKFFPHHPRQKCLDTTLVRFPNEPIASSAGRTN